MNKVTSVLMSRSNNCDVILKDIYKNFDKALEDYLLIAPDEMGYTEKVEQSEILIDSDGNKSVKIEAFDDDEYLIFTYEIAEIETK